MPASTMTGPPAAAALRVTVLAMAGCPGAALVEQRLARVLAGVPGVAVSYRIIASEQEAFRWGMHGSPTILVGGSDPFAVPGQQASMSCRMFPAGSGRPGCAPAEDQLRAAIARAARL